MDSASESEQYRDWQDYLATLAAQIEVHANDGEWHAISPLLLTYSSTLRHPPAIKTAHLEAAYRAAQVMTAGLERRAKRVREETAQEVRQLKRGRRAVSAYR